MKAYRTARGRIRDSAMFMIGAAVLALLTGERWLAQYEPEAISQSAVMAPRRAQRAAPKSFAVTIEKVHDGDTLWGATNDVSTKYRLWRVDAPEIDQPHGDEAQEFTSSFCLNKQATVVVHGVSYNRPVVEVFIPQAGSGTVDYWSLNAALVGAGLAWVDTRYGKPKDLLALQAAAQAAKKGLWADAHPVAPWDWRKGKRR